MPVAPISAPLAGGRPGATVRVHPLLCAEMRAPPGFFDGALRRSALARALVTPRPAWGWIPIPAFLVEHPEAGPILVDCGFDASVARDPAQDLGRAWALANSIRMTPDRAVPAQLRARGIDPAEVLLVVMTHLHFDHASGARQLPRATFVCTEREWRAASDGGVLQGYNRRHLDPGLRWRTLDVGSEPVDLLGDGSIRLLPTPGHTDGHVSVELRLASGPLLLAGDAAYARRTIDERLVPLYLTGSRREYEASLDVLRAWVDEHPDAPVVCGHDPWSWSRLPDVLA